MPISVEGVDGDATLNGTSTVPWASKSGSDPVVYTLTRDAALVTLVLDARSGSIVVDLNGFELSASNLLFTYTAAAGFGVLQSTREPRIRDGADDPGYHHATWNVNGIPIVRPGHGW